MKTATLYWNPTVNWSNLIVEDEAGNRFCEREISKGEEDGWFAQSATQQELEEFIEQEGIDADKLVICDSY